MKPLVSIALGAVLTAAFLGPGTVTTAASAGSRHGYALLWALLYAVAACWVLQEASGRLSIASGKSLAEALRERYTRGWRAVVIIGLVLGAIVLGCAAYEGGNILGGVAGARLASDVSPQVLTLGLSLAAAILLWFGSTTVIALLLGSLVAVMGLAFVVTALLLQPPASSITQGLLEPSVPDGSILLVLGLVGTTVVPYNLFLGSGLARGQTLPSLRFGLAVAIIGGGLVSMAVLVVGQSIAGEFSFEALATILRVRLGPWGHYLFAGGLCAAGFTSAVTAPWAAAMTTQGLFASSQHDPSWAAHSMKFRAVWLGVLLSGTVLGVLGVKPVPVILLAQALNGILLPVVAIVLWRMVNDPVVMTGGKTESADHTNGRWGNFAMAFVVGIAILLGGRSLWQVVSSVFFS